MSIEFSAPPSSRRERREREELLMANGFSAEEALELAGMTGVIAVPGSEPNPAPSAEPEVPPTPVIAEPAEPTSLPSRRELRERFAQAVDDAIARDLDEATGHEPLHDSVPTPLTDELAADAVQPPRVVDVEVVEVVEQLFTSEPARAELDPGAVPVDVNADNGPLHWTDALAFPANLDPTDPASTPHLPALASDTNTIVLDDMPGVATIPQATGEIDLVVTGTILLPTSLTETGALDHLIDTDENAHNDDDISDEQPLSNLSPKSASAAVNANASAPAMVSEPVRQRIGVPTIIALAAGGSAGIVLIALGLGALLHLF